MDWLVEKGPKVGLMLGCSSSTIARVRQRFLEEGEAGLQDRRGHCRLLAALHRELGESRGRVKVP